MSEPVAATGLSPMMLWTGWKGEKPGELLLHADCAMNARKHQLTGCPEYGVLGLWDFATSNQKGGCMSSQMRCGSTGVAWLCGVVIVLLLAPVKMKAAPADTPGRPKRFQPAADEFGAVTRSRSEERRVGKE